MHSIILANNMVIKYCYSCNLAIISCNKSSVYKKKLLIFITSTTFGRLIVQENIFDLKICILGANHVDYVDNLGVIGFKGMIFDLVEDELFEGCITADRILL